MTQDIFNCETLMDHSSEYWYVDEIIENTFSDIFITLAKDFHHISFLKSIS